MTLTQRYIAFLRAINVGGHTVKMEHLRGLFEELAFSNVKTFIASGNVIFDARIGEAELLERKIERHLAKSLGYEVATFLRTPAELAEIVAHEAFPARDVAKAWALHIGFTKSRLTMQAKRQIMELRTDVDDFHAHKREVFYLARVKMTETRFSGAKLEKALGMPTTMRNITTATKLASIYAP